MNSLQMLLGKFFKKNCKCRSSTKIKCFATSSWYKIFLMIWSARKQYHLGFEVLLHINQCIINNKYYKDKNKSAVQMSTMPLVWSSQGEGRLILYQVKPSVSWQLMISMRLLLIANPCLPGKFDKLFLIFHNIHHGISFHFGHFHVKSGVRRQDACCQPFDRISL